MRAPTRLLGSKIPMQMFPARISLWLTLGRSSLESGSLSPVRRSRRKRFQQRLTRCLLREHRTELTFLIGSSAGQSRVKSVHENPLWRVARESTGPKVDMHGTIEVSSCDDTIGAQSSRRKDSRTPARRGDGSRCRESWREFNRKHNHSAKRGGDEAQGRRHRLRDYQIHRGHARKAVAAASAIPTISYRTLNRPGRSRLRRLLDHKHA